MKVCWASRETGLSGLHFGAGQHAGIVIVVSSHVGCRRLPAILKGECMVPFFKWGLPVWARFQARRFLADATKAAVLLLVTYSPISLAQSWQWCADNAPNPGQIKSYYAA